MNRKGNQVFRDTEERIESAFESLLEEKTYAQINVSGLCTFCGLHRTTFYAHYHDLEDLASRVMQNFFREMFEGFHLDEEFSLQEGFVHMLETIRIHQKLLQEGSLPEGMLTACLVRAGEDQKHRLRQALERRGIQEDIEHYYHQEFFIGGLISAVSRWLQEGCPPNEQEMAEVLTQEYLHQAEQALPSGKELKIPGIRNSQIT